MVDIPGLPYDGVTDVFDLSGNGKGVALDVWPRIYRVPIVEDPDPLDTIVLTMGEVAYASTSERLRVGDGYTPGGDEIAYTSDMDTFTQDLIDLENNVMSVLSNKANVNTGNTFQGNNIFNGNVSVTGTFTAGLINVTDEVYGVAWNGKLDVPTKNALYDKINALEVQVVGGVNYQGTWNASTNTPAIPASSAANKGWYYKVSVPGNTFIDGNAGWQVGDWIISNGTSWDKVDNTDSVTSVNGQTGIVVLNKSDVGLGNVDNTSDMNKPVSTQQQTALDAKATRAGDTFTGPVIVPYEAYSGTWNGNLSVPTKDAVYDQVQSLIVGSGAAWGTITGILSNQTDLNTALGLKYDKTGGTITGNVTISGSSAALTLNPTSGSSIIDVRGTGSTNDGLRISGAGATSFLSTDTLTIRNRATTVPYGVFSATGLAMPLPVTVPADAYAPGWNGSLQVPTKDAVYDKMEAVVASLPVMANYVAKAGDTMSGNLAINKADPAITLVGTGNATITSSALPMNHVAASHWFYAGPGSVKMVVSDTYLDAQVFAVHMGKQDGGVAGDFNVLFKNTSVYSTINFSSTAADGTAGQTDGYIQSKRSGPLAISGITGLDFRAGSTQVMAMNSVGLTVTSVVYAKASVPATSGYAGITCGNTTNSGYLEVYGADQARAAYIGYADTATVYIVAENSRQLFLNAASFSWKRASDSLVLATLNSGGLFEAYQICGKNSAGTFPAANQVQSVEARAAGSGDGAFMAFHTPGLRAMHIGLDADNFFKFGGWGWTGYAMAIGSTGILKLAGNAIAIENAAQGEIQFGPGASHGIHYMSSTNAGFYKGGGNHFYCEMNLGGSCHWSGPYRSDGKQVYRHNNNAFSSADIFIGSTAPSGGNDGDIWLQYV